VADAFYRSGDIKDRINRYNKLYGALRQERTTFDAHWRELGDFLMPRRTRFWISDRNKGDKRNQNIIDSTGRFAARTLQSGLHAGVTSPARPWMKLSTPDPELAKFKPVAEWLHEVTSRMLTIFAQTNLYNVLPIVYGDMGVFATGCTSLVEDDHDLFRCYPYPIGSYVLGLDARGVATTFGRDYELTVRQIVEQFGKKPNNDIDWTNISDQIKNMWDRGDYEQAVELRWMVLPNPDARPDKLLAKYMPWVSCHWELAGEGTKFLRESGFRSFPILAPRWDITGEDSYGTDCPGMTTLPDIKQLQIMQREKGKAIAKMVNPPLVGPPELRTQKTSLLPGDITYANVREGMQGLRAIHEITLNLEHLTRDIYETQSRIKTGFFEDLFLMLSMSDPQRGTQPITAEEVRERHEEKLIVLGPVLERINDELLEPLVDRVYLLMETNGLIPPAPPELEGVNLKTEYTSILHEAQKLVGVVALDRFVMSVSPIVANDPAARHKINSNELINTYGETLGVNPKVMRSDDEAAELAGQEAKAMQAQAEAEQAAKLGSAIKSAATAPVGRGGESALDRLLAAGGGSTVQ
jgi:hypothetical protein